MTPKDADFPDLDKDIWKKTSDADPTYNCIAFAAGRTDVYWWPDDYPDDQSDYWPQGVLREESIAAFVMLFQSLGYEACADGTLEPAYEKIALYAIDETPTHAARQTPAGPWTSKLGVEEDIIHEKPESLAGPCYGRVVQFMRRLVS